MQRVMSEHNHYCHPLWKAYPPKLRIVFTSVWCNPELIGHHGAGRSFWTLSKSSCNGNPPACSPPDNQGGKFPGVRLQPPPLQKQFWIHGVSKQTHLFLPVLKCFLLPHPPGIWEPDYANWKTNSSSPWSWWAGGVIVVAIFFQPQQIWPLVAAWSIPAWWIFQNCSSSASNTGGSSTITANSRPFWGYVK